MLGKNVNCYTAAYKANASACIFAQQAVLNELRERLGRALGQQAAPVQTPRVRPQHAGPQLRQAFTPVQPATHIAPVQMQTPASAPSQQQYYQPVCSAADPGFLARLRIINWKGKKLRVVQVRSASTVTSWSNQTPTALPNVTSPPQMGPAFEQQQQQQVATIVPANPLNLRKCAVKP